MNKKYFLVKNFPVRIRKLLDFEGSIVHQHEKMFLVHQQRTLGLMMGCQIGAASSSSKLSILCLNRIQGDFTR
jgi:hypothetical protein